MVAKARDEFSQGVKDALAKRVGFRCSNPACRQPTSGPQEITPGTINVGVAAHVSAAAVGGPRYDATLSEQSRSSIENGLWLCQTCAKLIDSDEARYTPELLKGWRSQAEGAALRDLEWRRPDPSLPPYEVPGIKIEDLKADPEIGHLINEQDKYYFGRPGKLGGPFRKGYTYFLTADGRKCTLPNGELVLLVRRPAATEH